MSPCEPSALRSAWVIWPAFSSRDIRESRSATRFFTGSLGSRYGRPWASIDDLRGLGGGLGAGDGELQRDRLGRLGGPVLAGGDRDGARWRRTAVPAGKVSVPLTGGVVLAGLGGAARRCA